MTPTNVLKHSLAMVTVDKAELLERLTANRDGHREEFLKACDGYQVRLQEELERRLSDVKAGRRVTLHIGLPEPEDHTKDYDRVITMLRMELDPVVTIDQQSFAMYVMDDWEWKVRTNTTNAVYANFAR